MGPRKQDTGGARIELMVSPVATSGAKVPGRAALRAGEKPLAIEGVELTLEICPEEEGSEEPEVEEIGSMPGSKGISLAPGEEKLLEWEATLPECQLLYLEDPTRYAQLVVESGEEGDPTLWSGEEPLPMMDGWECKTVMLAAEIPGTDVAVRVGVHVIPEAAGPL